MLRALVAEPLTFERFAPFGDVIAVGVRPGTSANQGTATRADFTTQLISTRPAARLNVAVFRAEPRPLPVQVTVMERHPCSTQVFLPMVVQRYLVCVAPNGDDNRPVMNEARLFLCGPGQGISYRPNVWHHPMTVLDAPGELSMLAYEDGSARDCELITLDTPWDVRL